MSILNTISLESNKKIKINFNGGNLSSDGGLLLIKEFAAKVGLIKLVKKLFKTNDHTNSRIHTDSDNLMQMLYQIIAAYFEDDCADELTNDPVLTSIWEKEALTSQPTLSRFWNRMDNDTLTQLDSINAKMRDIVYSIKAPEHMLFDLDSTLLNTYGKQEGEGFNFHYQAHGYHPLLCYDGITGDLLKAELRNGTQYCSNDADTALFRAARENQTDYMVEYGEFYYQAGSWSHPRRVVFKVEKPYNQFIHLYTFIVTTMKSEPHKVIQFYCGRGKMENFIKEGKSGFDFSSVSSRTKVVNANRLQVHALAYNLFNWFRRLVLSTNMRKQQINTIRLKLLKVAAKVVNKARYIVIKLCSSCPYKKEFYETISNIMKLPLQLE